MFLKDHLKGFIGKECVYNSFTDNPASDHWLYFDWSRGDARRGPAFTLVAVHEDFIILECKGYPSYWLNNHQFAVQLAGIRISYSLAEPRE